MLAAIEKNQNLCYMPATRAEEIMRIVVSQVVLLLFTFNSFAQKKEGKMPEGEKYPAIDVDITQHLQVFHDSISQTTYRIILCADVPNNAKPLKVAYHQESGHVFLILQKIPKPGDTIHRVFGFYPKKGLPTLFFKTITSRIKDNSDREYDVEISLDLTAEQFDTAIARAQSLANRKYHINKYNCYDYALRVFNSVAGTHQLPSVYVRFPFIFGKGGSPVSVYKDLTRLKAEDAFWKERIRFGEFRAPVSTGRVR